MLIELTDEEIRIIRQGLQELPIKVGLKTLASFDEKVTATVKKMNAVPSLQMAQPEV